MILTVGIKKIITPKVNVEGTNCYKVNDSPVPAKVCQYAIDGVEQYEVDNNDDNVVVFYKDGVKFTGSTIPDSEIFFKDSSNVPDYMIFGGLPFYWSFLKRGLSLVQNIDSILFEKNAPLKIVLFVATQICVDFWLIEIAYPIVWIITTILMILYHKKIL